MTGAVLLVGGPGGRGAYWWGVGVEDMCLMRFIIRGRGCSSGYTATAR